METQNGQNKHWKGKFYTIAAGQAVSYIGSSAVQFALIWWITKETGSALMLSLAGLFAFLPQTLLGPFAGVWVDRLKRKTVMIAADLFTGLVALVFAGAFFFGSPPYWAACAVLGLRAIGGVFHGPAFNVRGMAHGIYFNFRPCIGAYRLPCDCRSNHTGTGEKRTRRKTFPSGDERRGTRLPGR